MFSQLWEKKLGSELKDIHLDEFSRTVSAGDASGFACIVDYYGNVLANFEGDISVWGIAHQSLDDGSIILAIGRSDELNNRGYIEIHIDHRLKCSFQCPEVICDVLIKDDKVFASGGAGSLYILNFDGELIHIEEFDSSLCGITGCSEGILVVKNRVGIIRYDSTDLKVLKEISIKNVSNNVCITETGNVIAGNYGPNLIVLSDKGLEKARRARRDIVSVLGVGDIVITGSKRGELEVWAIASPSESIYFTRQGAAILNIAFDEGVGYAFLALGDGNISCLAVDLDRDSISVTQEFLNQPGGYRDVDILTALANRVPATVLVYPVLNLINDNQFSTVVAKQICEHISYERNNAGGCYAVLYSLLNYHLGDYTKAINGFQSINSSHQYHSLAVLFIARSLLKKDGVKVASGFLTENISNIGRKEQVEALQILDDLGQDTSELFPAHFMHSSEETEKKSLIEKLNEDGEIFACSDTPRVSDKVVKGSDLNYGVINYIKYEYPNYADHAKKILEKNTVDSIIRKLDLVQRSTPWSLDIGCATCRYPLWLSSLGFNAVGYDIDDDAIKICKARAEGNERVTIQKKNILDHPAEADRYSLVTCMMGTFNHVPRSQQSHFVRWVYDSLKVGGAFVFSSWNNDCPYNTHLHFYNRHEREHIRANTQTISETKDVLLEAGFGVDLSCPISYLPDECYDAWLGEVSERKLISIDENFRKTLDYKNAQMHVFGAVKI